MTAAASPWAPLRTRAFAVIWTATLVSNIGLWIRDVASGWLMTEMAPSPLLVALVQGAMTLPIFLLALPAGALADILDRRRMLVAIQGFTALLSVAMAVAMATGAMTPTLLLVFTFLAGIGAALAGPPSQAVVPELVDKPMLRPAVALNSLGINISRAIGPALGGAIIVGAGVTAAYVADAVSTIAVVAAFVWWRRATPPATLPPEAFWPAMRTGAGYVAASRDMRIVLVRAAAFFLFASAYWALLPLVARRELGADATFYGLMLTAVGAGAVAGALLMPRLAARLAPGALVTGGSLLTMAAIALIALVPLRPVALVALFLAGAAWIAVLTNLNVAAQGSLANWVRARGLAVYLMVFYGAMTAGSALWGQVAQATSIPTALLVAAGAGTLAAILGARIGLPLGAADLAPARHWPDPLSAAPVAGERGPVMITIDYRVALAERDAFLATLHAFSTSRRRDGGFGWRVFEDAADPERFTEIFFAASWLDHLRQHARVTVADAADQARLNRFHIGPEPPRITHHLAARPGDGPPAPG